MFNSPTTGPTFIRWTIASIPCASACLAFILILFGKGNII